MNNSATHLENNKIQAMNRDHKALIKKIVKVQKAINLQLMSKKKSMKMRRIFMSRMRRIIQRMMKMRLTMEIRGMISKEQETMLMMIAILLMIAAFLKIQGQK